MRCAYCPTTPTSLPPLRCHQKLPLSRRSLLYLSTALPFFTPLSSSTASPDTSITDRVFLDLSLCPSYFQSRTLGEYDLSHCTDSEPIGRLVLGLYGNLLPITVSNFKAMCTGSSGSSYKGTLIHKIFPGEFFAAGRQGRKDKGEVTPPVQLVRNTETVDSKAFLLEHSRPGVVSLCLSENDDDDDLKLNTNYHNVEFLITTGPGPCPRLDRNNIVFGSVLEVFFLAHQLCLDSSFMPLGLLDTSLVFF
ncbi:peptidyl-prolyl cis-trans isomerase CYP28, chloroplastic isoform X2 [Primulina tabacum]|uniref:peptidyl-prolyl cis-trans isomerase CYP28, chloroplastic isoform X2 n=1 Tax=Primulina tabacum TaxID=48773 RepID=UPI003F59A78E